MRRKSPIITAMIQRKKLIGNSNTPARMNKIPKHFFLSINIASINMTKHTIIKAMITFGTSS